MRSNIPDHSILLLHLLRRIIFLFLIVYITAIPVFTNIFNQFDLKCELREIYGEEDPKEIELIVEDIENNDQEFYAIQNRSSIYFHKFFNAFSPDIQLPPPKKS